MGRHATAANTHAHVSLIVRSRKLYVRTTDRRPAARPPGAQPPIRSPSLVVIALAGEEGENFDYDHRERASKQACNCPSLRIAHARSYGMLVAT